MNRIVLLLLIAVSLAACAGNEPDAFVQGDPDANELEPAQTGFGRFNSRSDANVYKDPDASEESPDASEESLNASEESPDASGASEESPDASEESSDAAEESSDASEESPDAYPPIDDPDASDGDAEFIDSGEGCNVAGTWRVDIISTGICFGTDQTMDITISDSELISGCRLDIERPLEFANSTSGKFSGSILFRVEIDNDQFTGTGEVSGTVSINGIAMYCSTVVKVVGNREDNTNS